MVPRPQLCTDTQQHMCIPSGRLDTHTRTHRQSICLKWQVLPVIATTFLLYPHHRSPLLLLHPFTSLLSFSLCLLLCLWPAPFVSPQLFISLFLHGQWGVLDANDMPSLNKGLEAPSESLFGHTHTPNTSCSLLASYYTDPLKDLAVLAFFFVSFFFFGTRRQIHQHAWIKHHPKFSMLIIFMQFYQISGKMKSSWQVLQETRFFFIAFGLLVWIIDDWELIMEENVCVFVCVMDTHHLLKHTCTTLAHGHCTHRGRDR